MTEFHSTLVDVNAVSKGTRTGGIRRFTALAVIGNYDVRPCSSCNGHAHVVILSPASLARASSKGKIIVGATQAQLQACTSQQTDTADRQDI